MPVWCPLEAMTPCGNLQELPEGATRDVADPIMFTWIGEFAECKLKHRIVTECIEHNNRRADPINRERK